MTTIRFTAPIANRRRGDIADLDDGSAQLLIAHGSAELHDEPPAAPDAHAGCQPEDPPRSASKRSPATG